jgi:hypothetical protein
MRSPEEVERKLAGSPYALIVLKPLVESQHAPAILDAVASSRGLWMFRHFRDVARSNIKLFTPDVNRVNLEPMLQSQPGNWRGEVVPDDVRELVARHYRNDMNPYDGGALFWYARNRLFFDLGLADDERVMPLKYEALAAEPQRWMRAIYEFTGVPFPGDRIVRDIHPQSVGLGKELELSSEIAAACEDLWGRLNEAVATR